MLIHVNSALHLEELVVQNEIVIIDFWAEWCAPCKVFGKVFESASQEHPDIIFAKVNLEHSADLADTFHIRSIPHLLVFKQNIIIYSESGSIPKSALKELILQAEEIDLSDIKKELQDKEL